MTDRERIFAAIALTAPMANNGEYDMCLYKGCARNLFYSYDHTEGCPWQQFRELPEVRVAVEAHLAEESAKTAAAERRRLEAERADDLAEAARLTAKWANQ